MHLASHPLNLFTLSMIAIIIIIVQYILINIRKQVPHGLYCLIYLSPHSYPQLKRNVYNK